MKREFSAGGIVFNDGQVLVIKNAAMRDPNKSYWGFPKGHIEKGESGPQAAVREIEEETGIKAEVIKKLGDSKYVFSKDGDKIFKVVSVFAMRYLSGQLVRQAKEILEVGWMSPEEALEKLSFKQDRVFLEGALKTNGQ